MRFTAVCVSGLVLLSACNAMDDAATAEVATTNFDASSSSLAAASSSSTPAAQLDASRGKEIGLSFNAYLSPWQEGEEEEATPRSTPAQFRATAPSQTRAQREAAGHRAHGMLRFTNDFSRAYVDVKVEGVDPSTVTMFHIHCGRPGILGPIVVDFAQATDIKQNLADGTFSVEIGNQHIVQTAQSGEGALGAATMGCVIPSPSLGSNAPAKVSTIAGLAQLATMGELYFNLHTAGQQYFGDMRGQIGIAAPSGGS